MQKRENNWYAIYDFVGNVTSGQLDQLEFQVPQAFTEQRLLDPKTTQMTPIQSGAQSRTWLLRPEKPWAGAWHQRVEFLHGERSAQAVVASANEGFEPAAGPRFVCIAKHGRGSEAELEFERSRE